METENGTMDPRRQSKYYGFSPVSNGTITIGHQKMADIKPELEQLYRKHFAETEEGYLDTKVDVDFERFLQVEERQQFVLFTVRDYSTLVGYLQYYVDRNMHCQRLQAREDAYFLLPEYRGNKLGAAMLDYAEDFLKKLGCVYVGMSDKSPVGGANLGPYLQKRGYDHIASYYMKKLE